MSNIEAGTPGLNYTGWECGACGNFIETDGICPNCLLEYGLWIEAMYVDYAELEDV